MEVTNNSGFSIGNIISFRIKPVRRRSWGGNIDFNDNSNIKVHDVYYDTNGVENRILYSIISKGNTLSKRENNHLDTFIIVNPVFEDQLSTTLNTFHEYDLEMSATLWYINLTELTICLNENTNPIYKITKLYKHVNSKAQLNNVFYNTHEEKYINKKLNSSESDLYFNRDLSSKEIKGSLSKVSYGKYKICNLVDIMYYILLVLIAIFINYL